MRRSILHDGRALEGLPLKLVIVAVILGISVPLVWSYLSVLDRQQTENGLRSQLDFFVTRVKQVYGGGPGNSANLELDLSDGPFTDVHGVYIGGNCTLRLLDCTRIRYTVGDGPEVVIMIRDPPVPMTARDGEELGLSDGEHTVRVQVQESAADLDGDGRTGDYVVVVNAL